MSNSAVTVTPGIVSPVAASPQLVCPSVHLCVLHCPEHATVVAAVVFVPPFTWRLREFGYCPSWHCTMRSRNTELHQYAVQLILRLCWSSRLHSASSTEDIASSDSVVANPSSASQPGRLSAVSVGTSFRMSGKPLCTCASEASRSDFVSNALAVSPQPRPPLDRAVDSG